MDFSTGSRVGVRGMGMSFVLFWFFSAHEHSLMPYSDLVVGGVTMAVCPFFAHGGVHDIIGNDLAGVKCGMKCQSGL